MILFRQWRLRRAKLQLHGLQKTIEIIDQYPSGLYSVNDTSDLRKKVELLKQRVARLENKQ